MRALIVALVLANGLAFAWWQGWLDRWIVIGRTPERLAAQLAPERLKVVSLERLEPRRDASGQPLSRPACWETDSLDEPAARELGTRLQALGEAVRAEAAVTETGGRHAVLVSAARSAAEAGARLEALKARGIDDVEMLSDGQQRFAIAAGVFGSAEAAAQRQAQLLALGLEGLQVQVQARQVGQKRTVWRAYTGDAALREQFADPVRAPATWHPCPAADLRMPATAAAATAGPAVVPGSPPAAIAPVPAAPGPTPTPTSTPGGTGAEPTGGAR